MLQWFKELVETVLQWVYDLVLFVPQLVCSLVLSALAAIIEAIPVPEWMSSASDIGSSIPSGVAFLMQVMRVPEGLAIIASALLLRFVLRRIPFIG